MKKVNLHDVVPQEVRSPKGKFRLSRRHLSLALGAPRDAGVAGGGHPFDVELVRLPAGATNFPFHAHAAQWEFYIIVSGSGTVRTEAGTTPVAAGDTFVCPPEEAHQLINTGDADLVYYVIADNPPADIIRYPDSNKLMLKPSRTTVVTSEAGYYDGEE